jgi:hypothetical protein
VVKSGSVVPVVMLRVLKTCPLLMPPPPRTSPCWRRFALNCCSSPAANDNNNVCAACHFQQSSCQFCHFGRSGSRCRSQQSAHRSASSAPASRPPRSSSSSPMVSRSSPATPVPPISLSDSRAICHWRRAVNARRHCRRSPRRRRHHRPAARRAARASDCLPTPVRPTGCKRLPPTPDFAPPVPPTTSTTTTTTTTTATTTTTTRLAFSIAVAKRAWHAQLESETSRQLAAAVRDTWSTIGPTQCRRHRWRRAKSTAPPPMAIRRCRSTATAPFRRIKSDRLRFADRCRPARRQCLCCRRHLPHRLPRQPTPAPTPMAPPPLTRLHLCHSLGQSAAPAELANQPSGQLQRPQFPPRQPPPQQQQPQLATTTSIATLSTSCNRNHNRNDNRHGCRRRGTHNRLRSLADRPILLLGPPASTNAPPPKRDRCLVVWWCRAAKRFRRA